MNHSGDANKMVSETPRTDEAYFKPGATMYDMAGEMKRVERELAAAKQRIKRLEEAVDAAISFCEFHGPVGATPDTACLIAKNLRKAKEAKP